jgi:hypothetical protein
MLTSLDFRFGLPSWERAAPGLANEIEVMARVLGPDGATPAPAATPSDAPRTAPLARAMVRSELDGNSKLGGNLRLGERPAASGDATADGLDIGSEQFQSAIARIQGKTAEISKIMYTGKPAAGGREIGLSIFDNAKLNRARTPEPKRASNGVHWDVEPKRPGPLGDRNSLEPFSRALVELGASQEQVQKLVAQLPEWHKFQPDDAYHGLLYAIRSANLMVQLLEETDHDAPIGYRPAPNGDKMQLILAALMHRTDAYSGRIPGTSPTKAGTARFITGDPYSSAILSRLRPGAFRAGHVAEYAARTYRAPGEKPSFRDEPWKLADRDGFRRGFGERWASRLDLVSRAAMFVDSVKFARDAVVARHRELAADAKAEKRAAPSLAEVFLSAHQEVKALTRHEHFRDLPEQLQTNARAVLADFEAIARGITERASEAYAAAAGNAADLKRAADGKLDMRAMTTAELLAELFPHKPSLSYIDVGGAPSSDLVKKMIGASGGRIREGRNLEMNNLYKVSADGRVETEAFVLDKGPDGEKLYPDPNQFAMQLSKTLGEHDLVTVDHPQIEFVGQVAQEAFRLADDVVLVRFRPEDIRIHAIQRWFNREATESGFVWARYAAPPKDFPVTSMFADEDQNTDFYVYVRSSSLP